MLHKSFKPAKCKTSLRLATSRIKLMKNKKGVQINQMNKELAQLLQTGQDRTARIRVEHVIREEKMVAAYELIEIYCELIVARLPIIESQKTCPIDLKEAVTSVIFAAPRCGDISELVDIRKQFTAKYGKDFVSAALELRPDCGVSRMLVEKLSAVAPDVQTKVKVLSAVAKEHNIEWDATSFEEKESKPANDLLNGPPNFEKASMANADPPKVQPSNAHVVHSHEEKPNAPINYSEQNRKYTLGTQNVTPTDNVVGTSSAATHDDTRSSGITSERMEMRPPVSRGDNDYPSSRENWNMEFKDATSAAQAAAESAERAAMAARAAAQFSNEEKFARQRPTGSHVSNTRDETSHVSATSGSTGEGHYRERYDRSSNDRKPKIPSQRIDRSQYDMPQKATERFDSESKSDDRKPKIPHQHVGRTEHDTSYKATERYGGNANSSGPTSFRSNNDSSEDEKLVNDAHRTDGHFEESKTELGSPKESFEYENVNYFADEDTIKQPSMPSSHSRSGTSSDELAAAGQQKAGKKSVVGNPFAVVDQGSPFREATDTSSHVDFPRHDISDDEAISDDDGGPKFDTGFEYDGVEDTHSLGNAHIWSPRRNKSTTADQRTPQSHLFTESVSFGDHSVKSVGRSEIDDHELASFDHSDGPDSDNESGSAKFDPEPVPVESSQDINSRKTRFELNDLVETESSFKNPGSNEKRQESQQPPSRLPEEYKLTKHNLEQQSYETFEDTDDSLNQSDDLDNKKELNFGTLTGGFRNKGGLKYPPYTKNATTDTSYLSKRASKVEDKQPSSDSDSDDHSGNVPVQSFEKASKPAITRPRLSPPTAFVSDDGTDSEEEVSKHVPSRVRLGSGLSRRTRGPPSAPHATSHVDSEPKRVIPSQYSYSDEVPVEPRSYARRFEDDAKQIPESHKQTFSPSKETAETSSTKSTTSKPRVKQAVETEPEPKIPTHERIPTRIVIESGKTETAKKQNMGSEKLPGENLVKKQTHVHPKLPDYDSFAAYLQSQRTDRQ